MKKLIFMFFLVLFLKEAAAIGIVTTYLEDNTLELMEGKSATYEIKLQNTEEETEVRLVMDSEIAEIIDYKETYVLPKGVSNTPVAFNITAPKDAKVGDEYVIGYYMEPMSGKGGLIPLGIRINKQLKVRIIEDPNKSHIKDYLIGGIIAAIISVLFFIVNKRKHKKSVIITKRKHKRL